ncbi:transporter substrate-binding domain-containing protein [Niveibacterium sp. 24ML]|uniref:substrate-binding periplasmic protein n=1 Tax=Niveibacterium sp. 24ML TaxID=2985512 RepID=UPI002270FD96|nr:transporter substrate-binding domain-containing protein [Niveibacterium sp. 24ML]MCX9158423.1 transporter substrate-binding domain-containing protein [Niveibacterium sp. 24ML]
MTCVGAALQNRWRAALLILTAALQGAGAAHARELVIVSETFAPYVFEQRGEARGFDYEVSKAVLARLGYTLNLQFAPWRRALVMAASKQVDGVLGIGRGNQNEREAFLAFPDEALSGSRVVLFYLKGRPFHYEGLFSLAGKTVGTLAGYTYSPDFASAPYFTREPVDTHEQNLRKLLRGHIDLALIDTAVGLYAAQQLGVAGEFSYEPHMISGGRQYIAFTRARGHDKLAQDFSKALVAFKKTDDYRAIFKAYGIDPASVAPPEF